MSTPDRKVDRLYLSRHTPEHYQQRSPFRRAGREPRRVEDIGRLRLSSPTKHGSRHRRNFRKTQTLRGAFEAASRDPAILGEDDMPLAYYLGNAPSPRPIINSPPSEPPDELRDIYRQIDEEDSLTDCDAEEEEFEGPVEDKLESRLQGLSSGPALRDIKDKDEDVFGGYGSHALDDITDPSLRRAVADRARDEQRLKRVTSSRSPVFSRARVGSDGLTAENLQRRDEEAQPIVEDDNDGGPSLNLPSTWGSRAAISRSWMRNIHDGEESREEKRESADALGTRSQTAVGSSVRPVSSSERSPGRRSYLNRNALGERTLNTRSRATSPGDGKKVPSGQQKQQYAEEDNTPNTPVVGYKTSAFTIPSPTKRDSQQLLRRLSRNLNSSQDQIEVKTPEPQKPPESRIYDKTPVVTGAWIDTPVTERPAKFPEHLSQGLSSAIAKNNEPAKQVEPERPSQRDESPREEKPAVEEKPKSEPQPAHETTRPPLIRPSLPKSGLETVMEDVRADKDALALGDDTIESLQLLLDEQPTEYKTEAEEEAASEKAILEKLDFAKSQGKDAVDLDRLNEKLQSLVQNINEVKKGLSGLEDQVSADAHILSSRPSSSKGGKGVRNLQIGETCDSCGLSSDGRLYTAIPVPRLFKRDPVSRRISLTRLGWCTLISAVWLFSESTMCDYYAHPLISNVCKGNCLMHDAPRFPFVIPTMLWRWLNLSEILAPLIAVSVALFKLAAQLLGLWDGYVDDVPRGLNLSGEIRIRGSQVSDFSAASTTSGYNLFPKKLWPGRSQTHNQAPSVVPSVPSLNLGSHEDQVSMDEDEFIA